MSFAEVLLAKNGFFAFDLALHLFLAAKPIPRVGYDLAAWNSRDLWRQEYGDLAEGLVFFAEDLFGCQWAFRAAPGVRDGPAARGGSLCPP